MKNLKLYLQTTIYEFIIYPVTRIVIHYIRTLDDGELENII